MPSMVRRGRRVRRGRTPSSASASLGLGVVGLALLLAGCRPGVGVEPPPEPPAEASASTQAPVAALADPLGPPPRWVIDGTTLAADPSLPLALDRALREFGRAGEEVQDHILFDLNGDARLDAVVLLPAPNIAGAYDQLVLLSDGEAIRVHDVATLIPGASFAATVVPLVDGPTLVGLGPRLGGCERGPEWTFLRPTGALLEPVGSVRVDDYDCAVAEASVEFERDADAGVTAIVVRHGEAITRYVWDSALGSFTVAPE